MTPPMSTDSEKIGRLKLVRIDSFFEPEKWEARGLAVSSKRRITPMKRAVEKFRQWLCDSIAEGACPTWEIFSAKAERIEIECQRFDSEERQFVMDVIYSIYNDVRGWVPPS